MKNVKARPTYTHGPIVTYEKAIRTLPKIESVIFAGIMQEAVKPTSDAEMVFEIDLYNLSKVIGVKHDQVSDAIRNLGSRRFNIVDDRGNVFEYTLISILGLRLRHTDKPVERVRLMLPYAEPNAPEEAEE